MTNESTDQSENSPFLDFLQSSGRFVQKLEVDLGIAPGFFQSLLDEGDWSFLIKTHALLEAAVSHLISAAVGKPELNDILDKLNLNDDNRGKTGFLKAMNLLPVTHIRFIRAMCKMRNLAAHDVNYVSATLPELLAAIPQGERLHLLPYGSNDAMWQRMLEERTKPVLWLHTMDVLAMVYTKKQELTPTVFSGLPGLFGLGLSMAGGMLPPGTKGLLDMGEPDDNDTQGDKHADV